MSQGIQKGDRRIDADVTVNGILNGTARVAAPGYLNLQGVVSKDLILEAGGRADVYGVVSGDVVNRGGRLRVFGTIGGTLTNESGEALVHPSAQVGKIVGTSSVLS